MSFNYKLRKYTEAKHFLNRKKISIDDMYVDDIKLFTEKEKEI